MYHNKTIIMPVFTHEYDTNYGVDIIIQCFRYKYFSHLKSLKMSEERQPLGRMLSVPSPLPSAEGISGLGELKNLTQDWSISLLDT